MSFQKGQRVTLTCAGRSVPATILMASENQRSLVLNFDAIITGHVGAMPVLLGEDGVYRSILDGVEVQVK